MDGELRIYVCGGHCRLDNCGVFYRLLFIRQLCRCIDL